MANEWVVSLKVGDEVAMNIGSYGFPTWRITTVEKVTPTHIIKTANGRTFNNDGRERGVNRGSWSRTVTIEPVTDEVKDAIERSDLLSKVSRTKFETLDTTQLRKICLIIGEI